MRHLAKHLFLLLLLQGVVLVALGIRGLIYPAVFFGQVAAIFVWNGAVVLTTASSVRNARGTHEVRECIEAVA